MTRTKTGKERKNSYQDNAIYILVVMRIKNGDLGFMPMVKLHELLELQRGYPVDKDNLNKSMKRLAREGIVNMQKDLMTSRLSIRLSDRGLQRGIDVFHHIAGERLEIPECYTGQIDAFSVL
ncbi:hypothetical protein [Vibrio scophthalmi]|uniref:Uncharacterized protein n=1 Tax=Vibrio scophthalmi TaxID=45658 RepID=A0A1E3WJ38_9VIBR|nr:hypothetical protein [Vibrio scophthalmi]ODS09745.1 hypothetical protein VSF3289_03207 [Vibrio scophthalmi]